jgi:hypothetical protein
MVQERHEFVAKPPVAVTNAVRCGAAAARARRHRPPAFQLALGEHRPQEERDLPGRGGEAQPAGRVPHARHAPSARDLLSSRPRAGVEQRTGAQVGDHGRAQDEVVPQVRVGPPPPAPSPAAHVLTSPAARRQRYARAEAGPQRQAAYGGAGRRGRAHKVGGDGGHPLPPVRPSLSVRSKARWPVARRAIALIGRTQVRERPHHLVHSAGRRVRPHGLPTQHAGVRTALCNARRARLEPLIGWPLCAGTATHMDRGQGGAALQEVAVPALLCPACVLLTRPRAPPRSRVEYVIKAKSNYKRRSTANNVEIVIPVPPDADSPSFKVATARVPPAVPRS